MRRRCRALRESAGASRVSQRLQTPGAYPDAFDVPLNQRLPATVTASRTAAVRSTSAMTATGFQIGGDLRGEFLGRDLPVGIGVRLR